MSDTTTNNVDINKIHEMMEELKNAGTEAETAGIEALKAAGITDTDINTLKNHAKTEFNQTKSEVKNNTFFNTIQEKVNEVDEAVKNINTAKNFSKFVNKIEETNNKIMNALIDNNKGVIWNDNLTSTSVTNYSFISYIFGESNNINKKLSKKLSEISSKLKEFKKAIGKLDFLKNFGSVFHHTKIEFNKENIDYAKENKDVKTQILLQTNPLIDELDKLNNVTNIDTTKLSTVVNDFKQNVNEIQTDINNIYIIAKINDYIANVYNYAYVYANQGLNYLNDINEIIISAAKFNINYINYKEGKYTMTGSAIITTSQMFDFLEKSDKLDVFYNFIQYDVKPDTLVDIFLNGNNRSMTKDAAACIGIIYAIRYINNANECLIKAIELNNRMKVNSESAPLPVNTEPDTVVATVDAEPVGESVVDDNIVVESDPEPVAESDDNPVVADNTVVAEPDGEAVDKSADVVDESAAAESDDKPVDKPADVVDKSATAKSDDKPADVVDESAAAESDSSNGGGAADNSALSQAKAIKIYIANSIDKYLNSKNLLVESATATNNVDATDTNDDAAVTKAYTSYIHAATDKKNNYIDKILKDLKNIKTNITQPSDNNEPTKENIDYFTKSSYAASMSAKCIQYAINNVAEIFVDINEAIKKKKDAVDAANNATSNAIETYKNLFTEKLNNNSATLSLNYYKASSIIVEKVVENVNRTEKIIDNINNIESYINTTDDNLINQMKQNNGTRDSVKDNLNILKKMQKETSEKHNSIDLLADNTNAYSYYTKNLIEGEDYLNKNINDAKRSAKELQDLARNLKGGKTRFANKNKKLGSIRKNKKLCLRNANTLKRKYLKRRRQ